MYRSVRYRKHFRQLVEMYGHTCYYCREEMATTIDHVVPASWDDDGSLENLVPACALCNSIAGDKVFSDVEHKRQHIMNRRDRKKKRRCICTECLLPYAYREQSPSLFLCADCYDIEYGTQYSANIHWLRWIRLLEDAGIIVDFHRQVRKRLGPACSLKIKRQFIYGLIELYEDLDLSLIAA